MAHEFHLHKVHFGAIWHTADAAIDGIGASPTVSGHVPARRVALQGGAIDEGLAAEARDERSADALPICLPDRISQAAEGLVMSNLDQPAWQNAASAECFLLGCREEVGAFAVILAQ